MHLFDSHSSHEQISTLTPSDPVAHTATHCFMGMFKTTGDIVVVNLVNEDISAFL